MPKELDEFKPQRKKKKTKYPWNDWFCGRTILLLRGEDYTCEDSSLMSLIRRTAKRNAISISVYRHVGGVVIKPKGSRTNKRQKSKVRK